MGLGNSWSGVIDVLEDIIPLYDRVNNIISFGSAKPNRIYAIRGNVHKADKVLDAGSGFGNMSSTVIRLVDDVSLTLHDALVSMLHATETQFGKSVPRTCGVFEHLPFHDSYFDVVMCGYSLRDAIDTRVAISELHRVLHDNGRLIIVDLGKPDNAFLRAGAAMYLRCLVPLIGLIIGGRLGLKFSALYETYRKLPQNKELKSMLLEKFSRIKFETRLLGGAVIVIAYK